MNISSFFAGLVSEEFIRKAFGESIRNAPVYSTAVTLWTFLSQVLHADHGCVQTVAKLIAYRTARGMSAPSANTGAYCIARDKLDESAMQRMVTRDIDELRQELVQRFSLPCQELGSRFDGSPWEGCESSPRFYLQRGPVRAMGSLQMTDSVLRNGYGDPIVFFRTKQDRQCGPVRRSP